MLRDIREPLGADLLALMAIVVPAVTGEYDAGIVVVLTIAGGQALDEFASARAQKQLRSRLERAPLGSPDRGGRDQAAATARPRPARSRAFRSMTSRCRGVFGDLFSVPFPAREGSRRVLPGPRIFVVT